LAGIEPPVSVTLEAPTETAPPQVVVGTPAIVTPLGRVSVNGDVRVATVASGLLKVMVRVELPPALMVAGLKALPIVGGRGVTGSMAHDEAVTRFESIVTAPFRANALPETVASVVRVTLASARMFPMKDVPVPMVAELPTCQNTLQA
jgi:hypothetical protein